MIQRQREQATAQFTVASFGEIKLLLNGEPWETHEYVFTRDCEHDNNYGTNMV